MNDARPMRPADLARAAQIAAQHGVEIVIEDAGRVYRLAPARQAEPDQIDEFATRSLKR